MFNKKKKSEIKTTFTIESLIYSLKDIMTENPRLSMDSDVIISDLQMSEFKKNFKLYVINDYETNKAKLGIFLLPNDNSEFNEEPENQEELENYNTKVIEEPVNYNKKVIDGDGFEDIDFPEPVRSTSWMDKYGV
jgi:hypothetical protein